MGLDELRLPEHESFGFGGEKLPDLNHSLSFFGSIWYYPNVHGSYATNAAIRSMPSSYNLGYNILKYQIGVDYVIGNSPVFIEGGWMGDSWTNKQNAPVNRSYNGPFAGLGVFSSTPSKQAEQARREKGARRFDKPLPGKARVILSEGPKARSRRTKSSCHPERRRAAVILSEGTQCRSRRTKNRITLSER